MGVAGAGLGTLISRAFEFCMICGYFFLLDQKIGFRLRDIGQSCKGLVSEYLQISFPVMVSDTLLGMGNSMIMAVWGHMGTVCIVVIFMMTGSILTKGVLRSGGDTCFLMVADILFLWLVSVPLGALSGLVWK